MHVQTAVNSSRGTPPSQHVDAFTSRWPAFRSHAVADRAVLALQSQGKGQQTKGLIKCGKCPPCLRPQMRKACLRPLFVGTSAADPTGAPSKYALPTAHHLHAAHIAYRGDSPACCCLEASRSTRWLPANITPFLRPAVL